MDPDFTVFSRYRSSSFNPFLFLRFAFLSAFPADQASRCSALRGFYVLLFGRAVVGTRGKMATLFDLYSVISFGKYPSFKKHRGFSYSRRNNC